MLVAVLILLAIIIICVGVMGLINPAIPGLPIMYAGIWLLAYTTGYQAIGMGTLITFAVVVVLGMAMDFVAGLLGAKYTGASKTALWGATIGGIVGMFLGLFGIIIGPPVGAIIGEIFARREEFSTAEENEEQALRSTKRHDIKARVGSAGKVGVGVLLGYVVGVGAKIGCAFVLILGTVFMFIAYYFFS